MDAEHARTIVVVDDNRDGADTLVALLSLLQHRAFVAYEGETGHRVIVERQPDLAILDIRMPGIDGLEVARRVRAEPGLRQPRLVALTAAADPDLVDRCRSAGFDQVVGKPISSHDLAELLLWLRSHPPTGAHGAAP